MPILDLQRRMRQAGRIRIGQQVRTSNGKTRPAKLECFRLTSPDESAIRAAADLLGGEAHRWEGAPVGEQWEVVTEASTIAVVVPPAATAFSQWYELWSGGGCVRRCDGMTEVLTESPCLCAAEDERSCSPHSRLNVLLGDLPGVGVWRLDTSGWYAATELAGTVDVIVNAATRGQLLPAVLRLEQRQVKRNGEQVKKFAVPVLDIRVTPSALGLVVGSGPAAVEHRDLGQLEGSWHPIGAEPAAIGSGDPATSDAIRQGGSAPAKRRSNSPPELPPTGLNPRGAAEDDTKPSEQQTKKIMATFNDLGFTGQERRDERLAITSAIIGRTITSTSEVTGDEASKLIDQLVRWNDGEIQIVAELDGSWSVVAVEPAEGGE